MKFITIDMDALAKAIDCNTDATEQDARSIINTVLYHQKGAAPSAPDSAAPSSLTDDGKIDLAALIKKHSIQAHGHGTGEDVLAFAHELAKLLAPPAPAAAIPAVSAEPVASIGTAGPWTIEPVWPKGRKLSEAPRFAVYRDRPGTVAEQMKGQNGRRLSFHSVRAAEQAILHRLHSDHATGATPSPALAQPQPGTGSGQS